MSMKALLALPCAYHARTRKIKSRHDEIYPTNEENREAMKKSVMLHNQENKNRSYWTIHRPAMRRNAKWQWIFTFIFFSFIQGSSCWDLFVNMLNIFRSFWRTRGYGFLASSSRVSTERARKFPATDSNSLINQVEHIIQSQSAYSESQFAGSHITVQKFN